MANPHSETAVFYATAIFTRTKIMAGDLADFMTSVPSRADIEITVQPALLERDDLPVQETVVRASWTAAHVA
jgi:hypothetical protein